MKYINRNVLEFPIASAGKIYMQVIWVRDTGAPFSTYMIMIQNMPCGKKYANYYFVAFI